MFSKKISLRPVDELPRRWEAGVCIKTHILLGLLIIPNMRQRFRSAKAKKKDLEILNCDLLQSVKSDGHVLQSTRLPDEEKDGVAGRHAPQFLVHLWAVAEEVVHTTFGDDLKKEAKKNTNEKTWKCASALIQHLLFFFSFFDLVSPILSTLALTYPGGKVEFGLEVRHRLRVLSGHRQVTEVGLHGVTGQLEVHLLLLTTLGAKHPLPQVRVVEMPCLPFAGTVKGEREGGVGHTDMSEEEEDEEGEDTDGCELVRLWRRWTRSLPKQSSVLHVVLHFEEQHQGQLSLLDNLQVRERGYSRLAY